MNSATPLFSLSVEDVLLAPGEATPVRVRLQNDIDEQLSLRLELWGLESGWYQLPGSDLALEAKTSVDLDVVITIPRSYPAATLPVTLRASSVGSTTGSRYATFSVTVGDARSMSARLDPSEIEGRHAGAFRVILRNRGLQPEHYTLSATTTSNGMRVHFDNPKPLILAGQEGSVTGRVVTRRRLTGSVKRHPFAIVARGRTRPVELTAAFVSHPMLGSRTSKVAVLLAVLLVWGALASIGISAFDSSLHRRAVAAQTIPSPTARAATTTAKKNTTPTSSKASSPSSSSPSSSSSSSKSSTSTSTGTQNVSIAGTVGGSSPGGVQVTATPEAAALPATAANTSSHSPSSNAGVIYANTSSTSFNAAANTQLGPQVTTYTAPDGAFVLAGLKAGVSYLVTFSKPGFTTHKVLLPSPRSGQRISLSVTLVPGTGTLSGAVLGPNGPLGNAKVTVSNGLLNFVTHTASTGSGVGDWTVSQLSTPGSYLVQVSATGYGTQVTTVTLGPSASKSNVNTTLSANVGSIAGVISSATTNQPLGGAKVTATDGVQTVNATSFTVGKVGAYALPNLAIPAHWILTISGSGYQTQTEDVNLSGNATVNTVLSQSGGNLTGTITLPSTTGNNATTTIGLVLSGGAQVYKTLSTSRALGSSTVQYQFPQVLPGVYTLTAEGYGFTTTSTNVTLTAGATTTSNLTLTLAPASGLNDATITGTVNSAVGGVLAAVPIELNGTPVTTTNSNGSYTINNVAPGVATITAVGTKVTTTNSNGYTTQSQQVDVASGGAVTAPTIVLGELSSISGQFLDAINNEPIGQASVPGCKVTSASVQLTQNSKVIDTASATSADDYSFTGVAPGNYVLKASATCFESTQIAIDITNGQNLTQQLELSTTPTYSVLVEELVSSANGSPLPEPIASACVTLSPKGSASKPSYALTESNGVASFANLTLGTTYSVNIAQYSTAPSSSTSCATASGTPIATQATSFTAEPNGSTNSVFLTPQFQSFQIGLSFPFIDATASGSVIDCSIGGGSTNSSSCPT
ncbi:MAG: carboxypeptidase regulatory-like domain-containing protein, partial [Ferrimicrobium acidiphilum]